MGATVLHLEISGGGAPLLLPPEVFGSETLYSLYMVNCEIDRGVEGKVSFSSLKSLNLSKVLVEGDTIWDIIRSCPLIEQLILSECACLEYQKGSRGKTINFMLFWAADLQADLSVPVSWPHALVFGDG
ncbi:F-box/RNI-like superfamily protein [Striga asiatica]|uniref:F-box/RNI-like superfamily protein n=1 Tax=Striga asiatica TaxID=4170 RepID=A0A5A7PRA1_STRAF|nr:F-box/RNI-like superfamily protein [Striga asiatica]